MPASLTPDGKRRASDDASANGRRAFLQRLTVLGVAGLGLSGFLAACGEDERPLEEIEEQSGPDAMADASTKASECEGYDELTPQELQTRETLEYVDESPNPDQVCSNCRFYIQPEGGEACGGCELFAGPVAPGGYCISWAAMPS